jgi:general stress protein 26
MSISAQYEKIAAYINDNPVAILGTIGDDDRPHGAVVYVCADDERPVVYFLTKDETRKFKNLSAHKYISLTIANERENSTLQATGKTKVVHDSQPLNLVTKKMHHIGPHGRSWVPPLSKINAGKYKLVGITLEYVRLTQFSAEALDGTPTVTEL